MTWRCQCGFENRPQDTWCLGCSRARNSSRVASTPPRPDVTFSRDQLRYMAAVEEYWETGQVKPK